MATCTFVDGAGRELPALPELAGLAVRVDARSAVLDGELVVVGANGLADADELARRLGGARGRPVAYLAFDLLAHRRAVADLGAARPPPARRSGRCSGPATRSWPCPRSPARAGRSTRRPRPRGSPA